MTSTLDWQDMDEEPVCVTESAGELLRTWRRRRRMTQLDVACEADLSTAYVRHLETGKATADADTLLQLAECLRLPLRVRNAMLVAGGHPPAFPLHGFEAPSLRVARDAVHALLHAQEPYPAFAIDRHWRMLASNQGVKALVAGVEPLILRPPVNVLRLFLHPAGLAPRIVNLAQWRDHLTARLQRAIDQDRDPALVDLLEEVRDYPCLAGGFDVAENTDPVSPLRVVTIDGTLSFIAASTRLDMVRDVTLSEMCIETFVPADADTAAFLRRHPTADDVGGGGYETGATSSSRLMRSSAV